MRMKKENKFKYFIRRYIAVLIILMIIIIIYVISSLISYENLQVDNYLNSTMSKLIDAGKKNEMSKYVDISGLKLSKYEEESSNPSKALSKVLDQSDLKYKLNSDSVDLNKPVYDVYANDNPILNVELNGEKKATKLGILTVQEWELGKINLSKNEGAYECVIKIPDSMTAYVNNIKVEDTEIVDSQKGDVNLELSKYIDIPHVTEYRISNLLKEPIVKIKDENGKEVE